MAVAPWFGTEIGIRPGREERLAYLKWKISTSLTQAVPATHFSLKSHSASGKEATSDLSIINKMLSILQAVAVLGYLAAFATATPTKAGTSKRSPLDISLPPLIPAIPGVTEPLASTAPPLPILQLPTPPLDSPPFTASDIKPKKIGYFWTGAGDNIHKDFLATVSLDDDTFGTIITLTDVPTSGNSPHHLGTSLDGKTLVGGGLLSLLKTQDTAFYFGESLLCLDLRTVGTNLPKMYPTHTGPSSRRATAAFSARLLTKSERNLKGKPTYSPDDALFVT